MPWQPGAAAAIFAATFLLLAAGRIGRQNVPRGAAALAGGLATALLLGIGPGVVDVQVILLLAGLMALAAAADAAGAFAPLRRRLVHVPQPLALVLACACMAAASALLLNDAAVVVLIPVLLPVLRARGVEAVAAVVWLGVAANVGSLLTPFGNPQNVVLARAGELGVLDFLRQQFVVFLAAAAVMAVPLVRASRGGSASRSMSQPGRATDGSPGEATGEPAGDATVDGQAASATGEEPAGVTSLAWVIWVVVAGFVAAAVIWPEHLGTAASVAALAAYAVLRRPIGRVLDARVVRGIDLNVLALFVGLYLLTAGLDAWFPVHRLAPSRFDGPWQEAGAVLLCANLVGNVPTILALQALDASWVAQRAPFLVSLSTIGGSILLTGSAATLLAAEAGRREGVEVSFAAYVRHAGPWMAAATAFSVWWMGRG